MKNKGKGFKEKELKEKVKKMIEQSMKLNLIKPITDAFEKTPCEKEDHKGKKESFNR